MKINRVKKKKNICLIGIKFKIILMILFSPAHYIEILGWNKAKSGSENIDNIFEEILNLNGKIGCQIRNNYFCKA